VRRRADHARALILVLVLAVAACTPRPALWVFTAPWDPRSDAALKAGIAPEAMVVSGWWALDSLGGAPLLLYEDPVRRDTLRADTRFLLVSNYRGERFHPEAVRQLATDAVARGRVADALAATVREQGYRGVVLDLEALEPTDADALVLVSGALAAAARSAGARMVAQAVPALDTITFPARQLLEHVDRLVVMLYDLHWSGSAPGPVAERAWAREALATWVRLAGARRLVAALPTYGYRWRDSLPTEVWGWEELRAGAARSGLRPEPVPGPGGLRLRMPGNEGEAFVADAVLVQAMARDAAALGVRTVALWRLGLEDPAVWSALGVR
jgi:peptidoglycan-N-acetylglucosamine deacetylase